MCIPNTEIDGTTKLESLYQAKYNLTHVPLQNFETWDTIEDHKTMGAIDYRRNMSKYVMVKVARRLFNMYIHGNG
jgi:hypothetical protein